jgi:hypothetical protein
LPTPTLGYMTTGWPKRPSLQDFGCIIHLPGGIGQ